MNSTRRKFISNLGLATAGLGISSVFPESLLANAWEAKKFTFEISLAEFSFASDLYTGKMTNMDFPARAVNDFEINVLEYVSGFFNDKHTDQKYLNELKQRCDDLGVTNHLIMVDGANIASLKKDERSKAVESHYPWVDAAKFIGCSSIRVNFGDAMAAMSGAKEEGSLEEIATAAVDGYSMLLDYARKENINVIVENHFGNSTNADWLVGIMEQVDAENKGFLPDFGNFCAERTKPADMSIASLMSTECIKEYDKYDGVKKMMPYAKGISAKTHQFDDNGDDIETDFIKMFQIIKESGWSGGYVGIEYEGGLMREMANKPEYLTNDEGIWTTKYLLEKVLDELGD